MTGDLVFGFGSRNFALGDDLPRENRSWYGGAGRGSKVWFDGLLSLKLMKPKFPQYLSNTQKKMIKNLVK
ncbi:hypothetical protein D3H64_02845 [Atopobacter sp. AH10]|nr:hypothetical protein D3H64_02845 [Atopobacter sp. AH10]